MPVGDGPAIAQVAARLATAGIREAVINAHHLADAFTPARLALLPLRVEVIREAEILGTAGAVANAAPLLVDGDVVVWNGDILAEVDVAALFEAHAALGAEATLCVAPRGAGEGTVGIGEDGRVVRLRGERTGSEAAGGDFLGVQVIGARLRRSLPGAGCLVGDAYMPALRRGARIATLAVPGAWDDIGTLEAYLAVNARWLAARGRGCVGGAGGGGGERRHARGERGRRGGRRVGGGGRSRLGDLAGRGRRRRSTARWSPRVGASCVEGRRRGYVLALKSSARASSGSVSLTCFRFAPPRLTPSRWARCRFACSRSASRRSTAPSWAWEKLA